MDKFMKFIPLASSSKGNAYLLQSEAVAPLLLEAGLPISRLREKLRGHNISLSDLAGCLVSHEHMDHAKAVKDLLKSGVDCWMSEGTAEALSMLDHHRSHTFKHRHNIITSNKGWYPFMVFALEHDAKQPVGFFIQDIKDDRLLFIPDTAYVENRFESPTLIAIECNYLSEILSRNIIEGHIPSIVGKRIRHNHMSLENLIAMLKANDLSRCREIWLLHLSDSNSDERKMIQRIQEATGVSVYVA